MRIFLNDEEQELILDALAFWSERIHCGTSTNVTYAHKAAGVFVRKRIEKFQKKLKKDAASDSLEPKAAEGKLKIHQ